MSSEGKPCPKCTSPLHEYSDSKRKLRIVVCYKMGCTFITREPLVDATKKGSKKIG